MKDDDQPPPPIEMKKPFTVVGRNSKVDRETGKYKAVRLPLSQKLVVGGIAGVIGAASTFPIGTSR